jgi:hypothetical protein
MEVICVSKIGTKHPIWTKELNDKLLEEISMKKNYLQLEVSMHMSHTTIREKLMEMGFDGLKDARKVLAG